METEFDDRKEVSRKGVSGLDAVKKNIEQSLKTCPGLF